MFRRFLHLVVHDLENSIYSLHRMNLSKILFDPSLLHAQAALGKKKMTQKIGSCLLPRSEIRFEKAPSFATNLTESCILFADSAGRTATYDSNLKSFTTMPSFNLSKGPNSICFSISQPAYTRGACCLYAMDLFPGTGKKSSFEVLSYFEDNVTSLPPVISNFTMSSYWCDLPLPPSLGNPACQSSTNMFSYTVVNNKTICVSTIEDGLGTYNFDTQSHVWSQAGKWVLPFYGKAEYVPEFNLWFGLSRRSPHCLCCFDQSTMDHGQPPVLQHTWDYLELADLPEPYKCHLVNMGSGRFCIVSFFRTMIDEDFAVFTGVQLVPCNNAEAPVHMIKHKSKRYSFRTHRIEFVL